MSFRNALASIFHLFAIFSFLGAGSFALSLYLSENARWIVIEALFAKPEVCLVAGAGLVAIGFVLMGAVYGLFRGKYLHLKMGRHRTDVDTALIHTAIERCLKKHFPESISLLGIGVTGRVLEIDIETKEPRLLEPLEVLLVPLLRSQFGLVDPFYLTVRSSAKNQ